MTLRIRRIDPETDDIPALLALILRSFAYMQGVIDPPSSAFRLTPGTLRQKARDEIALLAEVDGTPVGCAFLRPEPGGMYLGKLAVDPDRQGQGIGQALLAAVETVAQAHGAPRLRLETRAELTGNHRRFAAWGFVRSGQSSHPGHDRITTLEMVKPLRSAPGSA